MFNKEKEMIQRATGTESTEMMPASLGLRAAEIQ